MKPQINQFRVILIIAAAAMVAAQGSASAEPSPFKQPDSPSVSSGTTDSAGELENAVKGGSIVRIGSPDRAAIALDRKEVRSQTTTFSNPGATASTATSPSDTSPSSGTTANTDSASTTSTTTSAPDTSSSSSDTAKTASTQAVRADSQSGGGDSSGSSGVPGVAADSSQMNFQADLFTGRFTYGVPIAVAPARQGAEPKIVLGYNSAVGNGWCGMGWTLDMGYIQRDTRHGVPVLSGSTVQASQGLSAVSVYYPQQHGYHVGDSLTLVGGTLQWGSPAVFNVTQVDGGGRVVQLQLCCIGSPIYFQYATYPPNLVSFTGGSPGNDGSAQANIAWAGGSPLFVTAVPVAHPYQAGDLLQIQGGVGFPATVRVVTVNAIGEPDQLQVVNSGCYSTLPPSPNSPTGGSGSGVQLNLSFGPGMPSEYDDTIVVSKASVNYPYAGYKVGDGLSLVGGTAKSGCNPYAFQVTQVVNGQITQLQLWEPIGSPYITYGPYAAFPNNPVSFTGGSGNGAQANITWTSSGGYWNATSWTVPPVAGSSYQPNDLLQIQGGVGTPAEVKVVSVNAYGEPAQLQVVNGGRYSTPPPNPNSPTGGSGSGVQLNLTFLGVPGAYDDSKGFISSFGGASSTLIEVGPTNQNPIIYRQQVDTSFLTYEYFTNDYWEVIDKSGNQFFFGEGIANQMENPKPGWTQGSGSSTWRWALDRVVDANGNETFLNYSLDNGMLYLTNILYNANLNSPALAASDEVDFILTNRPDTNFTYIGNYRVEMDKLLSEIDVRAGGQNVRKYVLGYTNSPSTLRSLLASVTQYGSDFTTALPPVTFGYQVESLTFGPDINWPGVYSQGDTGTSWNAIRATDGSDDYVNMIDVDGDGLPDRVMRKYASPYTNYFAVQRNTGSGFAPVVTNYQWGPLKSQGDQGSLWNSPAAHSGGGDNYYYVEFLDINGDGYPDRVMQAYTAPYTNFVVQYDTGLEGNAGFTSTNVWGPVTNTEISTAQWMSLRYFSSQIGLVDLVDMNGDGLLDWVNSKDNSPFDRFRVQLNNGSGFSAPVDWGVLDSQGDSSQGWNSLSGQEGNGNYCILMDINGDGLPDRVMRDYNSPYTNFIVQFNNGAGFEPAQNWGPINTQGQSNNVVWGEVVGTDNSTVWAQLVDVNGDGLPDRVMRKYASPYTNWVVQLNTGSGFGPPINWGPLGSQGQAGNDWNSISASSSGNTYVDFFDINGDGLPDRIMRKYASPYTNIVVELNQGPFPDLLNVVSNGLGGSVQVSYIASTTLNNRDKDWTNDPWTEGTRSLLPFNVWVVTNIVANDGMGNSSTNTYAFKGGYYNAPEREFRGFSQCTVTDPLGTKTITYFHQSGGRDNSALGAYLDQGSESKKGIPFRIEVVGSDGATNKITLNKVEEVELDSDGWYFPFISQTIEMNYEGLASYRATAKQFVYDTNTENLVEEADLGEVTSVVVNGQTFTDVGNDSVYTWMTYTDWGKPSDVKITSDSAGNDRLRETLMSYDSRGNLTGNQVWLNTTDGFITTMATTYDQYGNPISATDPAGITTRTIYDSTYEQYPITQITGTFTNQFVYDIRSGGTIEAIDPKGLVASNAFDVFFRNIGTYISTNAYGSPTLWQTKTTYSFAGVVGNISYNYIYNQKNDAVDPINGFASYAYLDGVGRTIQTRAESETAGQFRVANVVYDKRGNAYFQTLPYFSSGSGFTIISGNNYLGTLTEYDNVGRAYRVTPAVQGNFTSGSLMGTTATGGDTGSPVGPTTTAFTDGNNLWSTVVTDSEGKVTKSYRDAYGRTIMIAEITANGNYDTTYGYDLLGNLTNVTDSAENSTGIQYDSLGRRISLTDPNMGMWTYTYDNAGRMTQQTDARSDTIKFYYNDPLGRLSSKNTYNSNGQLVNTVTYTYDQSDDPNYTVYPGQLYKVTDSQGYQRYSYDIRNRVVKSARYLNVNSMEYVTQTTYDDAGRVNTVTYPGNAVVIQYSYDTAGNLSQVKSLSGTGTNEVFYTPTGFNALGQLVGCMNGNGFATANTYYPNSQRLEQAIVSKGTNVLQNLFYTYDAASDITTVNDGAYTGAASASISSITYDDLYQVTSVTSAARGVKTYAYNSVGNVLTNQDFGPGAYVYGSSKPYAVTGANGVTYGYDACGNMTNRGNQTLTYDAQNQLIQVSTTNDTVRFGYDAAGTRLWRCGTNGYTVWIGGIYEINNGKVLCHVIAGGKLVATFEPQCNAGWAKVFGEKNWYLATTTTQKISSWPFEKGRGQWSMLGGTWAAIFGVCLMAGRKVGRASRLPRRGRCLRHFRTSLWHRFVTLLFISAFVWGSTPEAQAAPMYNPVFYYYYSNSLGSSNILTDRSGNLVQHYEYGTYGQTTYTADSSAFPISNLYTGQVYDDETGLYFYGSRFYDPQLGRFVQPDTIVPSPSAPQTLNRYTYCGNNPLKYVDPTGHFWIAFLIEIIVGAVIGAATAAATGGNMWMGALTGAIGGAFGGLGAALAGASGAVVGGAIGGIVNAEITGGNVGIGALTGYIAGGIGFGVSQINLPSNYYLDELCGYTLFAGGGALGGGIGAELEGGNFWKGAEVGAIGGAIGYDVGTIASSWSNPSLETTDLEKYEQEKAAGAYKHSGGFKLLDGVTYTPTDGFSACFTPAQGAYPAICAFRGTQGLFQPGFLTDWKNNIEQALCLPSSQYKQAHDLALQVFRATGGNVVFVGHSLGGGLAAAAAEAVSNNSGMGVGQAVTFNAAGLFSFSGYSANIQNYFIRGEILTTLQDLTPFPHAWGTQIPYSFNTGRGTLGHSIDLFP